MATNDGKFVCYYRVSTGGQGKSGLGLDAQRAAVATYLNGGSWQIVDEFTEVESGKRPDRPALDKALAAARLHRASLVVSKVDRLTRSVAFCRVCSRPASTSVLRIFHRSKVRQVDSCFSRWSRWQSSRPA